MKLFLASLFLFSIIQISIFSETAHAQRADSLASAQEKINSGRPLVVFFTQRDCEPCREFYPVFKRAESQMSGTHGFSILDIEGRNSKGEYLGDKFNIEVTPTIAVYKKIGGKVNMLGRREGSMENVQSLIRWIRSK
jgi:thioredoxin-related protein